MVIQSVRIVFEKPDSRGLSGQRRIPLRKKEMNKTLLSLFMVFMFACGAPVLVTQTPESVNKEVLINTAHATEQTAATMTVCNSGGLNIRPAAGDLSRSDGWKQDGDNVTVILPAFVTPDMGMWYELSDGGWVNARYLCD